MPIFFYFLVDYVVENISILSVSGKEQPGVLVIDICIDIEIGKKKRIHVLKYRNILFRNTVSTFETMHFFCCI